MPVNGFVYEVVPRSQSLWEFARDIELGKTVIVSQDTAQIITKYISDYRTFKVKEQIKDNKVIIEKI